MSLERITLSKGNAAFVKGNIDDKMYRIVEGKIGIYKGQVMADEDNIDELGQNALFGEMAMVQKMPRSVSAYAIEDGTVLEIVRESDYPTILANPDDAKVLVDRLSNLVHKLTLQYIEACQNVTEIVEAGAAKEVQDNRLQKFINRCKDVTNEIDKLQEQRYDL